MIMSIDKEDTDNESDDMRYLNYYHHHHHHHYY